MPVFNYRPVHHDPLFDALLTKVGMVLKPLYNMSTDKYKKR